MAVKCKLPQQAYVHGKFEWQTGFGAFSLGQSQLPKIIHYIQNQKRHHSVKTFKDEYIDFLKAYEIDLKKEYIFSEL